MKGKQSVVTMSYRTTKTSVEKRLKLYMIINQNEKTQFYFRVRHCEIYRK